MSNRQLKRLLEQQGLLDLEKHSPDNEDGTSDDEPAPPKPRTSAFAGFAALRDNDHDNEDDDEEEMEAAEAAAAQPKEPSPETVAPPKKSKKPKKKKKAKKAEAAPAGEKTKQQKGGLDEIDLALKELNIKPTPRAAALEAPRNEYKATLARLLSINYQHLKVINEMRALFGQETIDAVRATDEAQEQADRRRNRRQATQNIDLETFLKGVPGQKIADVVLKRNPFIQGKDTWPRAAAGGLSMMAVTDERVNPTEFALTHDKPYQKLEMAFYSFVNTMEPMQLVHFVHQNPYHVSGLVQVSKVAKQQDQNSALAADLCERALFTIGRVTLSSFRRKLEQGYARLDFARPENRQFWLAGYFYIKSLIQKGTYRTALEWVKLFLSISPKDEYSMLNFAHVLAIRAHQAQWFIDLCNSEYFNNEFDLPMKAYHKQTCVLAKLQLDDVEGAKKDLIKGMEELPWLYSALFSAINVDVPRSVWGVQPRDGVDALYTELYLHMAKDLWNFPVIISLLKEAGSLAQKVDGRSLPQAQPVPLSVGRFIYLDNTPSLMSLVPPEMLHASPNYDYDPLPPPLKENVLSYEIQDFPWRKTSGDGRFGLQGNGAAWEQHVERVATELRALADEGRAARAEEGAAAETVDDEDELARERGILQRFMDMLWMGGARGGDDDPIEPDYDVDVYPGNNPWAHDGSDLDEANEDDIPDLEPMTNYLARHDEEREDDDDDDDMPPLH